MKKMTIILIGVATLCAAAVLIFIFVVQQGGGSKKQPMVNANTNQSQVETNNNTNEATNTNSGTSIINTTNVVYAGKVFLKGYKTPSESYGILTADGFEIGLGKYDSMKEQFRPYVGDQVTVTFSKVCSSGSGDCCLSLFGYCGTVASWEPLNK